MLNAVKNSGEVRRIILGGTNLPESTSWAEVTVVFSNRSSRRAEQDCARDACGAEQESANPEQIVIEALAMRRSLILFDEMT